MQQTRKITAGLYTCSSLQRPSHELFLAHTNFILSKKDTHVFPVNKNQPGYVARIISKTLSLITQLWNIGQLEKCMTESCLILST